MGDSAVTGIIPRVADLEEQLLYSQERSFIGFDKVPSLSFESESRLFVGTVLLGDCNLDGTVDFSDISSMIQLLMSGNFLPQADCNLDGMVSFADTIRLFRF